MFVIKHIILCGRTFYIDPKGTIVSCSVFLKTKPFSDALLSFWRLYLTVAVFQIFSLLFCFVRSFFLTLQQWAAAPNVVWFVCVLFYFSVVHVMLLSCRPSFCHTLFFIMSWVDAKLYKHVGYVWAIKSFMLNS